MKRANTQNLRLGASLRRSTLWLWSVAACQILAAGHALADDVAPTDSAKPATKADGEEAVVKNARADTLDGSQSLWSGQLYFNYQGSTLDHPFAKTVENVAKASVPSLVELTGSVAIRYRIDKASTFGVSGGMTSVTPFQGKKLQEHSTLANPTIDYAYTNKWSHWRMYNDASLTKYTDYQSGIKYGYDWNPSWSNISSYTFDSGLNIGVQLSASYNTFKAGSQYDRSAQTLYSLAGGPYAEFAFNDTFSLRSVFSAEQDQNRDRSNLERYAYTIPTQSLGLSTQASEAVWLYTYIVMVPYNGTPISGKSTTLGLETIINLY